MHIAKQYRIICQLAWAYWAWHLPTVVHTLDWAVNWFLFQFPVQFHSADLHRPLETHQITWWVNPFISKTPSKPFTSSGSWLTLHYGEIYYLSAVNFEPATTDIIVDNIYNKIWLQCASTLSILLHGRKRNKPRSGQLDASTEYPRSFISLVIRIP